MSKKRRAPAQVPLLHGNLRWCVSFTCSVMERRVPDAVTSPSYLAARQVMRLVGSSALGALQW